MYLRKEIILEYTLNDFRFRPKDNYRFRYFTFSCYSNEFVQSVITEYQMFVIRIILLVFHRNFIQRPDLKALDVYSLEATATKEGIHGSNTLRVGSHSLMCMKTS